MKTRQGFVSNSSTSSFCIYGTAIEKDATALLKLLRENAPDMFKSIQKVVLKQCDQYKDDYPPESIEEMKKWIRDIDNVDCALDEVDDYEVIYEIEKALKKSGSNLGFEIPSEFDEVFIGREWSSVGDNETGLQFKDKIEEDIKKFFGKQKCATHQEAYQS